MNVIILSPLCRRISSLRNMKTQSQIV